MVSRRFQTNAISNLLRGVDNGEINPNQFSDPYKMLWDRLQGKTSYQDRIDTIRQCLENHPQKNQIITELLEAKPGERYKPFSEIAEEIKDVEWLWPGWIPRGCITLLGGAPGVSKSMLSLYLCYSLIQLEKWPDGIPVSRNAKALFIDAEMVPQIHKQRVEWWNMNTQNFYFYSPKSMLELNQQSEQEEIVDMVAEIKPELVVFDSWTSLGCKNENSTEETRPILNFINGLARDFNIGVIINMHLRKRNGLDFDMNRDITIDDFRGSGNIVAMGRSVISLNVIQTTEQKTNNGPRKMASIKKNVGKHPDSLGYELVDIPGVEDGVNLRFGPAPKPYQAPQKIDLCREWLLDFVRQYQPVRPKDVVEEAKGLYSPDTVYAAKKQLAGIILNTEEFSHSPTNCWKVAEGK